MKKPSVHFLFLMLFFQTSFAQIKKADSLKLILQPLPDDSNRLNTLLGIAETYYFTKFDSSLLYSTAARQLAKELNLPKKEVRALNSMGESMRFLGDYPGSLKVKFEALKLSQEKKYATGETESMGSIGFTYNDLGEYRKALQYILPALEKRRLSGTIVYALNLTNAGNSYDMLNMNDSALFYQRSALKFVPQVLIGQLKSLILVRLGNAFTNGSQPDSAMYYYRWALENCIKVNDKVNITRVYGKIARIYFDKGNNDSSLHYAKLSFKSGTSTTQRYDLMEMGLLLSTLYRAQRRSDSALYYQDQFIAMRDSLYGADKFRKLQLLISDEQEQQQKMLRDQTAYRNRIVYTALIAVSAVFLLLAIVLYRNNRQKQKANLVIESAYNKLKDTQAQLVQSEKMASLGELTAGIAHEIQNPLNFVNNFSEVSGELIVEAKGKRQKAKENSPEVTELLDDIEINLEKINHHGKRADAIVKGMLQHSRSSTGNKEPTDINALVDEYLKLAYHGFRGKDNAYEAKLLTAFDPSIGNMNLAPHEVGRVLLNIMNNAFYTTSEKKKMTNGQLYEPVIEAITKKAGAHVEITVKDNGNGIPEKIMDKIFQPFFTTKPTGQGTGLGLSLAYDIVKAHEGQIKVESEEGRGTVIAIELKI